MRAININHKSNKLYFQKDYAFYNHVIGSRDYVCVIWPYGRILYMYWDVLIGSREFNQFPFK